MLKFKKPISESKFNSVIDQALIERKLVILDNHLKEIIGTSKLISMMSLRNDTNREAFVYYNGFVYIRTVSYEYVGGSLTPSPRTSYWRYKVVPVQAFCIDTTYRGEP